MDDTQRDGAEAFELPEDYPDPAKPEGENGKKMLMAMAKEHEPFTRWALEYADLSPEKAVLDVGCGSGMTIKGIRRVFPGIAAFGVDYSDAAVELSRSNNGFTEEDGFIVSASVDNLPFADETFDTVLTIESFYFWPDHLAGLKEILRVLKPGGHVLIISDIHDCDGLSEIERRNVEMYHMFNPTLEGFKALLSDAGYERCTVHTKSGKIWVCAEGFKKEE